jgi:hypothetical protein
MILMNLNNAIDFNTLIFLIFYVLFFYIIQMPKSKLLDFIDKNIQCAKY